MSLVVVFLVVFLLGPLCFRGLTHRAPSAGGQRVLGLSCAVMAAGGLVVRYWSGAGWGQGAGMTMLGVLLIWFAWISVLAFGAQALRAADPSLKTRRWTAVLGAIGTTIPWFGLASARWAAG